MSLALSFNKINSKFKTSCGFAVVNANAKGKAPVQSLESVKTAFVHLGFPLTLSQCSISARLITPWVLNRLSATFWLNLIRCSLQRLRLYRLLALS